MKTLALSTAVVLSFLVDVGTLVATPLFYSDIVAQSPNGTYRVEAKSPDNRKAGSGRFQSNFTYTCTDNKTKKVLWTRKQPIVKEVVEDGVTKTESYPEENSPVNIFVDDSGWVVIRTGWDELIVVDRKGKDRCKIELLSEAMSKGERKKYVHGTTAGPLWAGYSRWYFAQVDNRQLFVIRPWWGRRIIVDVSRGELVKETEALSNFLCGGDREFVLTALRTGLKKRTQWETDECCEHVGPVLEASYLAGKLRITEAIPLLRELQDSTYSGSCTWGGSNYKPAEGRVDPSFWHAFTMRRVVHLSLRRLGQTPGQYPCTQFETHFKETTKERPYKTPELKQPRLEGVARIEKGMSPEDVLAIVGAPDFNNSNVWYYDMDTSKPFTLSIHWGKTGVEKIEKHRPPFWTTDKWDEEIVY